MSGTRLLRELVNKRLAAAAEEIFGLVEKTIAEYQSEVAWSNAEIVRLKQKVEQLSAGAGAATAAAAATAADTAVASDEACPSQEKGAQSCDLRQVKEEPLELSIKPELEATSSKDDKDRLQENQQTQTASEATSQPLDIRASTLVEDGDWYAAALSNDGRRSSKQREERKTCLLCRRRFKDEPSLVKHLEEFHPGKKTFKCQECGKEYHRKDHLAAHLRVHTGEKPHQCPFCGKLFAQTSNLNVHMRTHMGEKPFFSRTCGKKVTHGNHPRNCGAPESSGEKPFRCLVCGKKFLTTADLKVHMEIHWVRNPNADATV